MKILVRLPNWLGDMVMSVGFLNQLPNFFPGAAVSVIAKKGIHELLPFFPAIENSFVFSKESYKGFWGLQRFGKEIKKGAFHDIYFSLPNSFSAALMGYTTGAQQRVGYKNELRQILLTHAWKKPEGLHRADEYVHLLERFTKSKAAPNRIQLQHPYQKTDHVVVNINSEASSRRLTVAKAIELIEALRSQTDKKIYLIGAPKEKDFVGAVISGLRDRAHIENAAGKTSLSNLVELLATARLMLTTDSGPAHLSNALGTHTIVLFGAGDETHTAPYNPESRTLIRLGQLSCEPCEKNVCVRYGIPQCLERLDTKRIVQTAKFFLG